MPSSEDVMEKDIKKRILGLCFLTLLFSCNEEDKKCEDNFVVSYQRMGDAFEKIYGPRTGSFELKNLGEAIDLFLSEYEGVQCKYEGQTLKPTNEAKAMRAQLPELRQELAEKARVIPKVIYGEDNRIQVSQASSQQIEWAKATLAQISPGEWDDQYLFTSKTYGESYRLCSGERFYDELSVANCSGFLVAPDVVVTAGHCVQSMADCNNYKWVLDFKDGALGTSAEKVFNCTEIIDRKLDSDTLSDYAVIRLDRPITDRKFFRTRTSGNVALNTPLVLIGHPSGLPAKVAGGAFVRANSNDIFFTTNTDSFGGNSGSAVINAVTGVVEGILVRGDQDYDIVDGSDGERCRVERVCPIDGCEGEDVTKMTAVGGIPLIVDGDAIRRGFMKTEIIPLLAQVFPLIIIVTPMVDTLLEDLSF
jgi:hypothetical protein